MSNLSPVKNYLINERKLTPETLKVFKIGELGCEIAFPYFREGKLLQVKYLKLERPTGKKEMRLAAKECEKSLFGWQALPQRLREITICEGEIDAMSLYQYGIPALSVPFGGNGGGKQDWIANDYDHLAAFDKIYLCFDNDEEGQAAVDFLIDRLGSHRCLVVELPLKDANECLQAGLSADEVKTCFAKAKNFDPIELKSASLFVKEVIEEFYPTDGVEKGIIPPWEKCRGKILFRPDELSIWGGINGHGKSQMLGQIILDSMKQGAKVCVASLELKPKRLLGRLTRQAAGLSSPTTEYIEAIHRWYNNKLWIFNLVGNAKSERLIEVCSGQVKIDTLI